MADFEKLGVFYLGKTYDPAARTLGDEPILYDSADLVTHAVCLGMTGSGKTGLCLCLLEEAAIDGIPALVIDPKGDLTNLLLTFPDLAPADFAPWVNPDAARQAGLSSEEFAAREADKWRTGLAAWGQDGARIARLRAAVEMAIYTPGSTAGRPISILRSFAAPPAAVLDDAELLRDRLHGAVGSLLGLLGIEADPLQSREHILLTNILEKAWRAGQDLELGGLVQQLQQPPLFRVGVVDLESFFPAQERFALAMRLNNLLASPGFGVWLEGAPLELGSLLYTPEGKPRVAILSIAHLDDAQRMFFVSLVLNQTLAWMRTQTGTTSLRAILYMDEVAGYFPPVANPPSKPPFLTLMKQGRAFGLGVVLATQNPADLDYKGLTNAGTWFVGRLQTERDKARLMDGLEGIAAAGATPFDRATMDRLISGLGSRVFLVNNVHETGPRVFQVRWALSYLRGPLSREELKRLSAAAPTAGPVADSGSAPPAVATPAGAAGGASSPAPAAPTMPASAIPAAAPPAAFTSPRPMLPPDVPQYFLPVRTAQPAGAALVYEPRLVACGRARFVNTKLEIDVARDATALVEFSGGAVPVDWDHLRPLPLGHDDLLTEPAQVPARYGSLPAEASRPKSYATWKKQFADALYRGQRLELAECRALECVSRAAEDEGAFRNRLKQVAREARDREKERLREKFAPRLHRLQEQARKAQQTVARETEEAKQEKVQGWLSAGASLLEAFLGRKKLSATNVRRAATATRGLGRTFKASQDQARAEDNLETVQARLAELNAEFEQALSELESHFGHEQWALDPLVVKPRRTDVSADLVALGWEPLWELAPGRTVRAWESPAGG